MPHYEKDYEIIPYHPDPETNKRGIADFMAEHIGKPFAYGDCTVGVEINFNKCFYKPQPLRPLSEILGDLKRLNDELQALEDELDL